jgi:serine/threonine-protein kinase RsbW
MDYLYTLCGFFTNLGVVCELDDDTNGAIVTAVVEAATNAIQHGNRQDASKQVDITVTVRPELLAVSVRDMGHGLAPEVTAAGEFPEDVLALRGRGIALMRTLMDDVKFEWTKTGTTVRLVKQRPRTNS